MDAHVGRQLFEDALTGELGTGRTRILVTHHVSLVLGKTAYAVILGEGTVQHADSVENLKATGVFDGFAEQQQDDRAKDLNKDAKIERDAQFSTNGVLSKVLSHASTMTKKFDNGELDIKGKRQPKKFTEDEKRRTGRIGASIYKQYLVSSGGISFWGSLMMVYTVYQGLILGRSWFIGIWTRSYDRDSISFLVQAIPYHYSPVEYSASVTRTLDYDLSFYLGIYIGLSVVICIFGALKYFFVYMGSLRASKTLFEDLK